eukprot:XP_011683994.1 PREDICTED: uncharacterized protein LOC105447521 [Strongylocentrotus purpuratus]
MFGTFLVVFALVGPWGAHGLSAVVVEPVRDQGVEAALIVIPGAEIRGEAYLPLAESIQRESMLKLWVALTTDYIGDTPFPPQLTRAINIALDDLVSTGMPENTPIFFAGHSLGEALQLKDETALATKPVVVVEGVNHFQFASGDPPPAVVRGDISPDATATEAWTLLARVTTC